MAKIYVASSWTCPECGTTTHDRDKNAAVNILGEGLRVLSIKSSAGTVDYTGGGSVRPTSVGREGVYSKHFDACGPNSRALARRSLRSQKPTNLRFRSESAVTFLPATGSSSNIVGKVWKSAEEGVILLIKEKIEFSIFSHE